MECFAGVAGIADAVKLLAGSQGEFPDIVEALCNLATTGICKVNHKGSIPWAALRLILQAADGYRAWVTAVREEKMNTENNAAYTFADTIIPEDVLDKDVLNIDYSGKGFWNFMYKLNEKKLSMKGHATAPNGVMIQHVLMSMTETSLDDIAIYKWIFGKDAIKRKDYGNAFVERKSKGKPMEITFPKPVNVCKFATAVQSNLGASNREPAIPIKTKSGKANHTVDNLGTMLESLQSSRGYIVRGGANPADVLGTLTRQQAGIHKAITSSSIYTVGTTKWYKTGATTTRACYGVETDDVPVLQESTIFQM